MQDYFKLDNQKCLIGLNGRKPKFINHFEDGGLTHELHRYAYTIIEELADRNFEVPGFETEFRFNEEKGTVEVFAITNKKLSFHMASDWHIMIKGKRLEMHCDNSGSMDVYVGKDWEKDKQEFMFGSLDSRKSKGLPRINLHYRFDNHYSYYFEGRSDQVGFSFCNDIGRGHDLTEEDCDRYLLMGIEEEFQRYITGVVLDYIRICPPIKRKQLFHEPDPEFLSNDIFKGTTFYAFKNKRWGDETDARIKPNTRLLSMSTTTPKDHPLHKEMNDGFVYMEIKEDAPCSPQATLQYNYLGREDVEVFAVIPKNYNNFYILDAGIFDYEKEKYFVDNPNENKMPEGSGERLVMEQAKTMVPINEYKGGYRKPIVITNRILQADELMLVKEIRVEQ